MEKIYKCNFLYGTLLTPEQFVALEKHVGKKVTAEKQEDGMMRVNSWPAFEVNPERFKDLFPDKDITIGEPVPANHAYLISGDLGNIRSILGAIEDAIHRIESNKGNLGLPNKPRYSGLEESNRANPEPYFMMIKEVRVELNACTDRINDCLSEGTWHILAICPQPNQRRPDYILGKL